MKHVGGCHQLNHMQIICTSLRLVPEYQIETMPESLHIIFADWMHALPDPEPTVSKALTGHGYVTVIPVTVVYFTINEVFWGRVNCELTIC